VTAPTQDATLFDDLAAKTQLVIDYAQDVLATLDRLRITVPVAEVPVDGSVDIRWDMGHCTWSDWFHVTGEERCGPDCLALLLDNVVGRNHFAADFCVQVRPHEEPFVLDGVKAPAGERNPPYIKDHCDSCRWAEAHQA